MVITYKLYCHNQEDYGIIKRNFKYWYSIKMCDNRELCTSIHVRSQNWNIRSNWNLLRKLKEKETSSSIDHKVWKNKLDGERQICGISRKQWQNVHQFSSHFLTRKGYSIYTCKESVLLLYYWYFFRTYTFLPQTIYKQLIFLSHTHTSIKKWTALTYDLLNSKELNCTKSIRLCEIWGSDSSGYSDYDQGRRCRQ